MRYARLTAAASTGPDYSWRAPWTECFIRSDDGGYTWQRLTPEQHEELRNFDSVALDPANPQIIYAGTYHLPWKSTDGGAHWKPVHEGMIDDSDVMSILVDRAHPRRVYASACSGIYLSEDGATLWRQNSGHSLFGAAHASDFAGPGKGVNCLRGNDGRSLDHGECRNDLAAVDAGAIG